MKYYKKKVIGRNEFLFYRTKRKRGILTDSVMPCGVFEYYNTHDKIWYKSYDMTELSFRKDLIPVDEGEIMLECI